MFSFRSLIKVFISIVVTDLKICPRGCSEYKKKEDVSTCSLARIAKSTMSPSPVSRRTVYDACDNGFQEVSSSCLSTCSAQAQYPGTLLGSKPKWIAEAVSKETTEYTDHDMIAFTGVLK